MPPQDAPADVIVADRITSHGTKCVLGFTCSHAFPDGPDPDTEPDMSGPLYYARISKGGGWTMEIWAFDLGVLINSVLTMGGVTVPASSVAALADTAANANCG